ncbi:MAG: TonB-dependent receptor, partial [Pseudomonadota bacterium]
PPGPPPPARVGACASLVLCTALATPAARAQSADATPAAEVAAAEAVEEVIVTGTRKVGMQASDSPAPVQVLSAETLKESGAPDLMNAIATQIPSYNANQTGGDMASQTLTASMRALSANHALVLVNGKRRHITSNVGASSGNAAADLAFIPVGAIDRIEVLTDGAAAIYGSDAIAGVINIILKKDYQGGRLDASYGGYQDGGGGTDTWSGNFGFGSDKSYFNLTAEVTNQQTVTRAEAYGPAVCVANPADCQAYIDSNGGIYAPESGPGPNVPALVGYLSSPDTNMRFHPDFPHINRVGDPPEVHRQLGFFNAGYALGANIELYAFGNYGKKRAESFETYRRPSQDGGVDLNGDGDRGDTVNGVQERFVNKYAFGFNPKEASDEVDYSLAVGLSGETAGWAWDLSTVYGKDEMDVFTTDSMNFTIWNETGASPEDFYDGSYWATQWTSGLDLSRDFEIGLASPMTVASGVEFRRDEYGIDPGEPASYYGAGAASFPGYNPAVNTGAYHRTSYAAYVDFILTPTEKWLVDIAGRYEHYSDFGSETIGKLTTRYDFADWIAVRGTASTGFRAPTLGEGFYSAVNVGPTSANPQLQPNSSAAAALGFGDGLQPETSTNFSLGLVLHPIPRMAATIDAYQITIEDRIQRGSISYSTGSFANPLIPVPADGDGNGCRDGAREDGAPESACYDDYGTLFPDLYDPSGYNRALGEALAGFGYLGDVDPAAPGGSLDPTARANVSVSIFNNALKTRTRGLDLVATYPTPFDWGSIDWSVGANYNETEVLSAKPAPAALGGATLYSPVTIENFEHASPKYRVNFGALITLGRFSLHIREQIYGKQYQLASASGLPDVVRDQIELTGPNNGFYKNEIGVLALTNIELTYRPTRSLNVSIGGDNVFNEYPDGIEQPIWDYYVASYSTLTSRRYITGSPIGYFGARWFGKVSYDF